MAGYMPGPAMYLPVHHAVHDETSEHGLFMRSDGDEDMSESESDRPAPIYTELYIKYGFDRLAHEMPDRESLRVKPIININIYITRRETFTRRDGSIY